MGGVVLFEELTIPRQRRYKPKGRVKGEILGYDTETVNGEVYLISDSTGKFCYPRGDIHSLVKYLSVYSRRSRLSVTFNLRYDFQAIVKLLPYDLLVELWNNGKVTFEGITLRCIPKKLFSLRDKHRNTIRLYDISQFYPGMSLDKASRFYLGDKKKRFNVKDPTPEMLDNSKAVEYCIHDSKLAARLARLIVTKLEKLGVRGPELISPAYVSEQFFRQNCFIPQIDNIPKGALLYAFRSYRGGWFEGFKRGYFDKAYEYDINSAYPDKIRKLIDITKGRWKFIEGRLPKSKPYYGYVHCDVFIPPVVYVSPLMLKLGYICKNPTGNFRNCYLTLPEVRAIEKTCPGAIIEVKGGWYFWPEVILYPFRRAVEWLYERRTEAKANDPALYLVIKIILNSLYGKFWQKVKKGDTWVAGNLFNPFYATEITSRTRLQIYKTAYPVFNKIVAIATDSLITKEPLSIEKTSTLGAFNFVGDGRLINIMGGIRTMEVEGGNEVRSRFRGFSRGNINFFDLLGRDKSATEITFPLTRVVTLGEVVKFNEKYSPGDLNRFLTVEKTLDLNSDVKRSWESPVTAGDLLSGWQDSVPLFIYER